MAADSAAFLFVVRLRFFRNVSVERTFLMQWQNDVASGFNLDLILF
jgi:hypothetical protein